MKIQITKSCVVRGHPGVQPGDIIEVAPNLAGEIIGLGLGREAAGTIETREPVVENRDPVIAETPPEKHSKPLRSKKTLP